MSLVVLILVILVVLVVLILGWHHLERHLECLLRRSCRTCRRGQGVVRTHQYDSLLRQESEHRPLRRRVNIVYEVVVLHVEDRWVDGVSGGEHNLGHSGLVLLEHGGGVGRSQLISDGVLQIIHQRDCAVLILR